MTGHPPAGPARLRRRLLAVLLSDATAVAALSIAAFATRSRPSGSAYSAIATVAAASLAPAVIAVSREEHAHRAPSSEPHGMTGPALLFAAGIAINTAGTLVVLMRAAARPSERVAAAVDLAVLVGGNAVGLPYLSRSRALHEAAAGGPTPRRPTGAAATDR